MAIAASVLAVLIALAIVGWIMTDVRKSIIPPPITRTPPITRMPHPPTPKWQSARTTVPASDDLKKLLDEMIRGGVVRPMDADMFIREQRSIEAEPPDPNEGQNIQECPQCGEQKRIPENDYICQECRSGS